MVIARRVRLARVVARGRLGKLRDIVIAKSTRIRYDEAVKRFFSWTETSACRDEDTQDQMAEYVEALWEDGDPRAWAGDALSNCSITFQTLKDILKRDGVC